ncbi:MAG: TetR/AcrR family transcriptional regulator [Acidimicrobiia bacterium]|nr:TetR/AcrR family transcriptional regulator [Acidimicrobiia bacterium]
MREYFDRYTDTLVDAIGQILDSWGREPAPPFELRDLAVILTAMAAGISFRRSVDPESVPDNLGRDAILLLAPSLTRVAPGRDDRAPAVVAGSGSEHAGVAHSAQRAAGRRRVQRSRSAIIAAAWREFDLRGYADASIAAIAAGADVSETTVYEHFWSKAGVARACYEVEYRELSRALETDAAEPVARIRNHVVRLAALLRDHPALPAAVLDGFGQMGDIGREIHARDPRRLTPLPVPLVGPIREAKSAGRIRTDLKSIDIATAITTLTVVQVSHRPESSAESIARQVGAMTLDGVLTTAVREAADGDVAQDRT